MVRLLTAALIAVALDKPFVLNLAVSFLDHGAIDRIGPWRRPFLANLSASASGNGGMAWLRAPHIIEDTALHSWREASNAQTPTVRTDIVRWCRDAGVQLAPAEVGALDMRAPAASNGNAFDVRSMAHHGQLCPNVSRHLAVIVHSAPVANFEVLAANIQLAPDALTRLRTLTTRGVNAYGLLERALWPRGLTLVNHAMVERVTLAVHLRCWMLACSPRVLAKAAECAAKLLDRGGELTGRVNSGSLS